VVAQVGATMIAPVVGAVVVVPVTTVVGPVVGAVAILVHGAAWQFQIPKIGDVCACSTTGPCLIAKRMA